MKTIDDTARETAQEMGYKEPASTTDSSNGNSMMTPQNSLNDMAQSGVKEMKNMFDGVASAPAPGDFLNSTWEHVRSLMGGGGGDGEDNGNGEDGVVEPADADEIRCIENLEREKIIQFLQERHMSMNNTGRGKKV
ncbi:uncharacterized protein BO87DRAFT_414339 [Aspergillus neoniger CBS 115656]|uniref:Uncharacterized protein n=1 Tax=Aspergillus neoniger (strain CBS 115656) TaxID=1448310 RepID=A0A318YPS4_ASPNB|nr:hypothetical protein BO87DRAFT_414339 [Aspergillus neoniger CBS 115656]PYH36379.1 hypothetical protein BO87DRAFT_414339 [Aspergillus neoniger CBS 115656]